MKRLVRIFLAMCIVGCVTLPLSVGAQQQVENDALQQLEALQQNIAEMREGLQQAQQVVPEVYSEEVKGRITNIINRYEKDGFEQIIFDMVSGDRTIRIDTGDSFTEGLRYRLAEGQQVYVQLIYKNGEVDAAFLVDVVRTSPIVFLFLIFCVLVIGVGYWRGLQAIAGLGLTMMVLFGFIIPRILHGNGPVLIVAMGCVAILAINMHLSHGFNRHTFTAFLATLVGLALAVGFGAFAVWLANLSGLSSEETALLYFQTEYILLPQGILLAGIILGATGVLDDIAVTQSETVSELLEANHTLSMQELYVRGMRVGRHHIASTVNTLVLAYAGVALPLLLLFVITKDVSPLRFINEEFVAEEIVRTLAGTSALILTVPVATIFAAWVQKKFPKTHSHKH